VVSLVLVEPFRAVFYAPYYVALDGGHVARQGVALRLATARTPDAAAARLLDGSADLAWSGPMRPMLERSRDPESPLRSFGAAVVRDPFLVVGRGPRPGFSLADLASMRLAVPSEVPTPWWCLQHDLRLAGVDPAALPGLSFRPMAEGAAALMDGEADAALLFEPHASALEERGAAVWHAAASRGPTAYSALYATAPRIAEKRAAFVAVVRGLGAALAWMATAAPGTVADALSPRFPEIPARRLLRAIERCKALGVWSETTRLPPEALDRLAAAMISAGAMARHPGYAACVDASFEAGA
jgi:NitT/TauT family transport system substrate-binding protein